MSKFKDFLKRVFLKPSSKIGSTGSMLSPRYDPVSFSQSPYVGTSFDGDKFAGGFGATELQWTDYWTQGKGEFVSSAMEDTGTYQSLAYLDNAGKANKNRLLVLRTASNYTLPPPGITAVDYLLAEQHDSYAGLDAALENAYLVGSVIVDEILNNWNTYKNKTPGE